MLLLNFFLCVVQSQNGILAQFDMAACLLQQTGAPSATYCTLLLLLSPDFSFYLCVCVCVCVCLSGTEGEERHGRGKSSLDICSKNEKHEKGNHMVFSHFTIFNKMCYYNRFIVRPSELQDLE